MITRHSKTQHGPPAKQKTKPLLARALEASAQRLEALKRSETRYRRLFEAARDGILIVDPTTRKITDANPFMTELLGYSYADLLGRELWEIGLLKDEAASQEAFRELQEKHFIRYEDLPLQHKDGRRHEVEFVSNLYDEGGHPVIQCNIRDITARKRTEQALAETKSEIDRYAAGLERLVADRTAALRQTIGELEQFSYSLSHDLRAPLRAMQGFSQALLDEYGGKLDERATNYLNQIGRSAIRLDRLIRDVLSYTTLIHSPVLMEDVNLDRLVRDIIETYPNGQLLKPQIIVKGTLLNVMGNQALLTQCVSNLLANGVKFVAPGITPQIEVSVEARPPPSPSSRNGADHAPDALSGLPAGLSNGAKPPMVRLWIKDNGIGIAPEDHERVVRLFERIHPASEYEGTGIGLTIVKKAVERMGARFGFDSELGRGSQFWIELKAA